MSCSCIHHHLINIVISSNWHNEVLSSVVIASIHQHLPHWPCHPTHQSTMAVLCLYVRDNSHKEMSHSTKKQSTQFCKPYPHLILHTLDPFEFMGKATWDWIVRMFLNTKISSIQANEETLSYDTPLKTVLPFYLKKFVRIMQQIKQTNNAINLHIYVNEWISSITILTHISCRFSMFSLPSLYPPFCKLSETTMTTADGKSSLHWAMHSQSHPTHHEHTG